MRTLALILTVVLAAPAVWAQPGSEDLPGGNAAAGAVIVAGKGMCLTCHRVQGKGSRLGPDLTDIGTPRPERETRMGHFRHQDPPHETMMTSLIEPDAEILPENRFYRVVARDGAAISGRLLNLDTFQDPDAR